MVYVAQETNHGWSSGKSGDPSPVTAYGVYMGMKAAANFHFGNDSLSGKKIVVQGVGHVGEYLVQHLSNEGAELFVTDIHEPTLQHVAKSMAQVLLEWMKYMIWIWTFILHVR